MLARLSNSLRGRKKKWRKVFLSKSKPVWNDVKLRYYTDVKKDSVTFEIKNALGIGARLVWVLEILAFCDAKGIIPNFKFSYYDSPPEDDFFNRYFYIKNFTARQENLIKLESNAELGFTKQCNEALSVEQAHRLIQKYVGVHREILGEVESFCRSKLHYDNVLGVHYRATDKISEAPLVAYEAVLKNIRFYLQKYPATEAIFLSTDDKKFETYLRSTAATGKPLVIRDDYFRSDNNLPVHYNQQLDKYKINQDAVVNFLLLSRCRGLIKSASLLSDLSVLFNPAIRLVMLNAPYGNKLWFPAKDLLKRVDYPCV